MLVLNSFILSNTRGAQLRDLWDMDRDKREARNIYTMDDPDCIRRMIDKILASGSQPPDVS